MDWDEEHVIAAGDTVGYGGTLWILYLTNSTEVGINKTSDYHTQQSSVRSFTKRELGLPEPKQPVVREGYMSISNKPVTAPTGTRDVINNEHKNDLLSLTTLGHKLVTAIRQDDRLDMALRGQIGVVDEPNDPWWIHGPANDDHAVFLRTYSDRSELDKAHGAIDVIASFDCPRCGDHIEHEYSMELQDGHTIDGWETTVEVTCEGCGQWYSHTKADQYTPPEPL